MVRRPGLQRRELDYRNYALRVIFNRCPECGCIGPKAGDCHPLGTAERLWNLRHELPHWVAMGD